MGNKKRFGSFLFWQQWLFYSSLVFATFGILFALFAGSPLFCFYQRAVAYTFWGNEFMPPEAFQFYRFVAGLVGGTLACCYILLAYIAIYPFKRKELWVRNCIVISFGLWFIIDSGVCIYYGAYFQIYVFNVISLFQKLLPLVFTWKEFKYNSSDLKAA